MNNRKKSSKSIVKLRIKHFPKRWGEYLKAGIITTHEKNLMLKDTLNHIKTNLKSEKKKTQYK